MATTSPPHPWKQLALDVRLKLQGPVTDFSGKCDGLTVCPMDEILGRVDSCPPGIRKIFVVTASPREVLSVTITTEWNHRLKRSSACRPTGSAGSSDC
ncbi:MAG TPA: hypothetical protein EYQ50_13405 [Verrucomicrobiales bacterium]|nr:hypothetical protein [Verrucomicrobiales bacterium]